MSSETNEFLTEEDDESTEEDVPPCITEVVDKHVTLFLKMIEDPTGEIFFYYFEKKDKEVFDLTERVLRKFFALRKDRNNFTIPFRYTFCYLRTTAHFNFNC